MHLLLPTCYIFSYVFMLTSLVCFVCTLLLLLIFDFYWHVSWLDYASGDWLWVGHDDNIEAAVQGLTPWIWIHLTGLWCQPRPPHHHHHHFGYAAFGANQVVFLLVWSWFLGMLTLGSLGRSSHEEQHQLMPVSSLGLHGKSYKVICRWLLPMLNMEAHVKDHSENWGQLPSLLGLGQLSKNLRALRGLLLAAPTKAQLLKEPTVVHELVEVRSQWLTKVEGVMFTRLVQIHIGTNADPGSFSRRLRAHWGQSPHAGNPWKQRVVQERLQSGPMLVVTTKGTLLILFPAFPSVVRAFFKLSTQSL